MNPFSKAAVIALLVLSTIDGDPGRAPSGGTWAILGETQTASSSATIDFTSLSTTYRDFKVVISDVVPVTDNVNLWARVSVAASFKSGASDYMWARTGISTGAVEENAADNSDTKWNVTPVMGSAAGESGSVVFLLFNPADTANRAQGMSDGAITDNTGAMRRIMSAYRTAGTIGTSAVDGIQFLFSSGNIESGTFTLYGRMN